MLTRLLPMAFAVFLPGCFIIGTGVGSAIPKYETIQPGEKADDVDLGDIEPVGETVGAPLAETPRSAPATVDRLRVQKGNYWLTGFIVGGCLDVTAIVLSSVLVSTAMNQGK